MRISGFVLVSGLALVAGSASAQLAKLDSLINVDNVFNAYISADPNDLGTEFSSGNSWPTTYSGSYTFNDPGTYYLHVRAVDQGGPRMFIGTFSLTNQLGTSEFSNATQSLVTNTTDWLVTTTLGTDNVAPISFGTNGNSGTWGTQPQQSASAQYLWHPLGTQVPTVFFSTKITVVPAPGVLALVGLAPLGLRRSRR